MTAPQAQSALLRRALGRRVGRQGDPKVACLFPHSDGRRWEIRVGKAADGNGNVARKAFALPEDCRAAYGTEMKGQCVATFGLASPRSSLTRKGDLLATETRLVADHSARATLALEAVAHGYARWLTLNRKVKLAAAAGGASGGHG
jgi:hypothetical protein